MRTLAAVSLLTLASLLAFPRDIRASKMVAGVIMAVVLVTTAGILLFDLQSRAVIERRQMRASFEVLRAAQRLEDEHCSG